MVIIFFALAGFFSILLWIVSARFRSLLTKRKQVVMRWSLSGKPNSTATPRVALATTPMVGTCSLFLLAGLFAFGPPTGDFRQEDWMAPPLAIAFIGILLVAIHTAHLYFAARSDLR